MHAAVRCGRNSFGESYAMLGILVTNEAPCIEMSLDAAA